MTDEPNLLGEYVRARRELVTPEQVGIPVLGVRRVPGLEVVLSLNAGIEPLPLTPEEAATYGDLSEPSHNDPFDRMLVWQAISRKLTLISGDREFERFRSDGLKLVWK